MKRNNSRQALRLFAFLMIFLVSCVKQGTPPPENDAKAPTEEVIAQAKQPETKQPEVAPLPVRFQTPAYFTQDEQASDVLGEDTGEYVVRVGANISSTQGPQPLWDILKRLATLKGMTVSWASDVNQNALVDVNIRAEDDFFEAIGNMLRQVDYFHEVKDKTIVVKYKDTKTYHVPLPFTKQKYTSNVGGNFLSNREAATGTEGTVKITSADNPVDVWDNVKLNLDTILEIWSGRREGEQGVAQIKGEEAMKAARTYKSEAEQAGGGIEKTQQEGEGKEAEARGVSQRAAQGYYTIDKHLGIVTVTAPKVLLDKVDQYFEKFIKESTRQVTIEAKIIEVFLQDNSKIGIDWGQVLKDFEVNGLVEFGTGGVLGQVWPWNPPDERKPGANYPSEYPSNGIYKVSLQSVPFSLMLNALNEQGDATVLSNPKITVLNGQPAVINVGKDITFISAIEAEENAQTGNITYTAETDSVVEGIALGVMANIVDNDSVILHLTPITTDLVGDTIEYRQIGFGEVGLPVVQIREMSTMVQVNNGEMLIIGGLIDSSDGKSENFAPVVGDIPLIRYLFGVEEKRKIKRELVVLLTPKII